MVTYTLKDDLTVKKIKDELFVFDRTSGIIHTFNESGRVFWEELTAKTSFSAIVDKVVNEFDVSKETASEDLFDFIQELEVRALLSIVE